MHVGWASTLQVHSPRTCSCSIMHASLSCLTLSTGHHHLWMNAWPLQWQTCDINQTQWTGSLLCSGYRHWLSQPQQPHQMKTQQEEIISRFNKASHQIHFKEHHHCLSLQQLCSEFKFLDIATSFTLVMVQRIWSYRVKSSWKIMSHPKTRRLSICFYSQRSTVTSCLHTKKKDKAGLFLHPL